MHQGERCIVLKGGTPGVSCAPFGVEEEDDEAQDPEHHKLLVQGPRKVQVDVAAVLAKLKENSRAREKREKAQGESTRDRDEEKQRRRKTGVCALEECAACTRTHAERFAAKREKKKNEQREFNNPPGND